MTWHDRVNDLLRQKGWTAAELIRRSGVHRDLIYKYLKKEIAQPRGDTLGRIADALGTTESYLRFGIRAATSGTEGESTVALRSVPVVTSAELLAAGGVRAVLNRSNEYRQAPIPDDVPTNAIGLEIVDPSMSPRLPEGSIVIIALDQPPEPGRYVAAIHKASGQAVIRRWRCPDASNAKAGDLVPENSDFPTLRLASEQDGEVIGRAVLVIHRL